MTTIQTPSERITEEVTSWPGVEAGTGERGEFAFKVGRREIGHLHGDWVLHIGFPRKLWTELKEQGGSTTTQSSPTSRAGPRVRSRTRTTCAM